MLGVLLAFLALAIFVDEIVMSIMPIIFVLIILLFGFDSTEQSETPRNYNNG